MATWKFVVTDLLYEPLGELHDAYDVTLSRRINGTDSLSLRIRAENPFFNLLSTTAAHLKVYRNGRLEFFGPVWTAEAVGEADKLGLAATAVAPGKLVEKMVPTWQFNQMTYGTYDRQQAIASMAYWAARAGRTRYGADVLTKPSMPVYMRWGLNGFSMYYGHETDQSETLAESLTRLTAGSGGMDYAWVPTEPTVYRDALLPGGSPATPLPADPYELVEDQTTVAAPNYYIRTIARFEPDNPAIGVDRTAETVMEYGTGRHNLTGFKFTTNREYQANKVFQLAGTSYLSSQDTDSRNFWGALDETSPFDGLDATYVDGLMDLSVALRKDPMRRVEVTPASIGGPAYGTDYDLGDYVTVVAKNQASDSLLVNGTVRIHAVSLSYNENGTEKASLTITEES